MNFTLAILHLRALFKGSATMGIPDLPDTKIEILEMYGASGGEKGPSSFWTHKFPAKLRNPLQAAALITPLVLLMGNRLDNMNLKRDYLLCVSPV